MFPPKSQQLLVLILHSDHFELKVIRMQYFGERIVT